MGRSILHRTGAWTGRQTNDVRTKRLIFLAPVIGLIGAATAFAGPLGPTAARGADTAGDAHPSDLTAADHDGAEHSPRDVGHKPLADTSIEIDDTSLSATTSTLRIDVTADEGTTLDRVLVTASGQVIVDDAPIRVDGETSAAVEVDITTLTGDGEVTATLLATRADGVQTETSDTVWVSVVDGVPVVSSTGTQDLALQVADLGIALGTITLNQAKSDRDEAIGGADVDVVLQAPAAGPCDAVCVDGTVSWTDAAGLTHPVRRASVQIIDKNVGGEELITTIATDDAGTFSAAINGVDADGGPRDVFVRVLAEGPGFRFIRDVVSSRTQFIESPVTNNVAVGSTVTIPFVANNVDDNNTVFSLHNAMVIASEYTATVQSPLLGTVDIVFPATGTFYSAGRVNMLKLDRWDWDVMLHEYGHFVAAKLGIQRNPGGNHRGSNNLSDIPGPNKDIGVRLAWGEGWPTYFAVSLLVEMDAASLGIANIGDVKYQDTEDARVVHDLEVGGVLGEDNEVTVMSALWDLYDATDDDSDSISLGDQEVWSTLDAANPHTLSDAYEAFAPNGGVNRDEVNCVFSQMNVAPRIDGPPVVEVGAGAAAPTFTWRSGNGGINGRNDLFVLEIRDADGAELLHSSGLLDTTSYTVSQPAWSNAIGGDGAIDVSVIGVEANTPTTGPYRSCAREVAREELPPPLPVVPDPQAVITTVTPDRFVDTRRDGQTLDARFAADGRRGGGATYEVDLAGRGSVPTNARAVVVNVTAVNPDGTGFVTAFDCASTRPLASSLNFAGGINTGNEIVLGLGADGEACLFTSSAADLTVDVTGYVAVDSPYETVVPARLLDTRQSGQTTTDGVSQGGGPIAGGGEIVVSVAGRGGVPVGAVAAVVNVTSIGASATGYVTVHPCLDAVPNASSLNFVAGVNRGNELVSPLNADGTICLYASESTQLTVDVAGFVGGDTEFEVLTPARLLDTRLAEETIDGVSQGEGPRLAGSEYRLQIAGRHGIVGDARSVVVNVTAVGPARAGFVSVHPCMAQRPGASSLNYTTGITASNEIVTRLDEGGGVCLYSSEAVHLLVDVSAVVT
jgi:hypothetical protein